jgi:hypothetical protein
MDINTEKLIALLGNNTSPMPAAVHGHDEKIQQASISPFTGTYKSCRKLKAKKP